MEHILSDGLLLNEEGNLSEAGYSLSPVKQYHRRDIKAPSLRIKEWDYYYVGNSSFGFAFTIADNSYMDLCSITYLDFKKKIHLDKMMMRPFSKGNLNLPESSSSGKTIYQKGKNFLEFNSLGNGKRTIKGHIPSFNKGRDLIIDLLLEETLSPNSLVIATPFNKKGHFYYNQKINLLKATGEIKLGEETFNMSSSYGVLDWGRGVWTYKNTWYWSSLNGLNKDGVPFAWNLGYGFGDTSKASENILYIDGKPFKIGRVMFIIPGEEKKREHYLDEWKILGSGLKATFKPVINRHSDSNVLLIRSKQNQVFGLFSGEYIFPDGKKFLFEDVPGFAEKVYNRY